jgi:hypothetical protein
MNYDSAIIGGNSVQILRECLYPNGTPVPFTVTNHIVTYMPVISAANGFSMTNTAGNFLTYRIKQNVAGAHRVPCVSKPFPIINMGVATPPITPILAAAPSPSCITTFPSPYNFTISA